MQTLIFKVSRLVRGSKGQWSLRCSEGYSNRKQGPSSLSHFNLGGALFAQGIPNAVKKGELLSWTNRETEFRVSLNFSPSIGEELLNRALEIPEFQAPPLDEDGVSLLSNWQIHVDVDENAGISVGKRDEAVLHWDGAEGVRLVSTADPAFAFFERQKVNVDDVWEELGFKFESLQKPVLKGEEAREYVRNLLGSRNARRRSEKTARRTAESVSQTIDY